MNIKIMERELFICSCENTEHQIVFSWFEDEAVGNVYATIHLRKKSFWTRLKYGIKYIFGYQCRYGAFDEFIFNPNDARKLKKIARWLTNAKVGGKCIIPVTDEEVKTIYDVMADESYAIATSDEEGGEE